MSIDSADCAPRACFYIGANESDDEECFEPFSDSYISMLTQIWNDISTWDEGYKPPLELAIKILRILQGLQTSSHDSNQTIDSYNAFLNRRIAKVSAALQEYKEHLCTQVFSVLEEKEELELSEIKDEIQHIKAEIEQAKLLSYQKKHKIRKHSLLRYIKETFIRSSQVNLNQDFDPQDLHIIISRGKQLDQKSSNKEEKEEASTARCPHLRKLIWKK